MNDAKFKIALEKAKRRIVIAKPKKNKIKNWMTTRQLKDEVEKRLNDFGSIRINSKWCLQIRGKHMRRLKKKMKIKQVGRYIRRDE
jgi:plasmid maintenance system killer protein